jgi:hypothetical protein
VASAFNCPNASSKTEFSATGFASVLLSREPHPPEGDTGGLEKQNFGSIHLPLYALGLLGWRRSGRLSRHSLVPAFDPIPSVSACFRDANGPAHGDDQEGQDHDRES